MTSTALAHGPVWKFL